MTPKQAFKSLTDEIEEQNIGVKDYEKKKAKVIKALNVLDIIIEKQVDIKLFKNILRISSFLPNTALKEYNRRVSWWSNELTQKEFDLIKEWAEEKE